MKKLKVLLSVLLSAMLVLSMAAPAFADNVGAIKDQTGTITIDNPVADQTYSIYQILYLDSFDAGDPDNDIPAKGAYKIDSDWVDFFDAEKDGAGVGYVTIEDGYVTEFTGDIAEFVKVAKAYIDSEGIEADDSAKAANVEEPDDIVFDGLELGWYLVDSTLGTLCSIDTTKPTVIIKEKNTEPTMKKEVKEDSTGSFGENNSAQIGQTVDFKITVQAKKGAQNYIVRDIMDAGLSFKQDIVIKAGTDLSNLSALSEKENDSDEVFDYIVEENKVDEGKTYTFVITFAQSYLDTITEDTIIEITYSALLNKNAQVHSSENNKSNDNTATFVYGENPDVIEDTTQTFTYEIDVVKDNTSKEVLPGAEFKLYTAGTGGALIQLVKIADGVYALYDGTNGTPIENGLIVATSGQFVIQGLDKNDKYYLEETKAPAGYNKLADRKEIELTTGSNNATVTAGKYVAGGLEVVNKAGTLLPETGGTGTKVLFTVGGIMMVVAFVLITSKRRMAAEK